MQIFRKVNETSGYDFKEINELKDFIDNATSFKKMPEDINGISIGSATTRDKTEQKSVHPKRSLSTFCNESFNEVSLSKD